MTSTATASPRSRVASPRTNDQTRSLPGEVFVYSGKSGKELRRWTGKQPGGALRTHDGVGGRRRRRRRGRRRDRRAVVRGRGQDARRTPRDPPGRTERSCTNWSATRRTAGSAGTRRAPDPDGAKRPALLVGSLRHSVDGQPTVGLIDLYVLRAAPASGARRKPAQGSRHDHAARGAATSGRRAARPRPGRQRRVRRIARREFCRAVRRSRVEARGAAVVQVRRRGDALQARRHIFVRRRRPARAARRSRRPCRGA